MLKTTALGAIGLPAVGRLLARSRPNRTAVIMLHRFRVPGGIPAGHDPSALRRVLGHLRAIGVQFLSLDDLIEKLDAEAAGHSATPANARPTVAITVDDGYADLLEVGLPVFREFDCPVTGFVVPDMIDSGRWFWWDRVAHVMRNTRHQSLSLPLGSATLSLDLSSPATREMAWDVFVEALKRLPPRPRSQALAALMDRGDVPVPDAPPAEYRLLSWNELRGAERPPELRFGAHSLSHPVLSECAPEESRLEVVSSYARVHQELRHASRVFCYPYGRRGDFGARELEAAREAGAQAALASDPGRLDRQGWRGAEDPRRWALPRFSFDERPAVMVRCLLT